MSELQSVEVKTIKNEVENKLSIVIEKNEAEKIALKQIIKQKE